MQRVVKISSLSGHSTLHIIKAILEQYPESLKPKATIMTVKWGWFYSRMLRQRLA